MLLRLRPPNGLDWCNVPGRLTLEYAAQSEADLDKLDWQRPESLVFSHDLLRIALRYGVVSSKGIVFDAVDAADLGRADEIRDASRASDEGLERLQRSQGELFMERIIPGWMAASEEVRDRVRESTEDGIRRAEEDLAEVLAVPVKVELADHWTRLGGTLPE